MTIAVLIYHQEARAICERGKQYFMSKTKIMDLLTITSIVTVIIHSWVSSSPPSQLNYEWNALSILALSLRMIDFMGFFEETAQFNQIIIVVI
jgi:hypothetical protein